MAYTSVFESIVFIEGGSDKAVVLGNVSYDSLGTLSPQLKNLNHVKKELARQAKARQANCVLNFEYGQKTSWFSWDDTKWWGKGQCAQLPVEVYEAILKSKA